MTTVPTTELQDNPMATKRRTGMAPLSSSKKNLLITQMSIAESQNQTNASIKKTSLNNMNQIK